MSLWQAVNEISLPDTVKKEQIRIWLLDLRLAKDVEAYWDLISEDEQQRADSMHHERRRKHFVIARATLRHVLSDVLDIPAKAIGLQYGEAGRPELTDSEIGLSFNVSHSTPLTLIAVGKPGAIGVDIEIPMDVGDIDPMSVGAMLLSPEESKRLKACSDEERANLFFRIWTVKEAVLKMLGLGFSIHPREINVLDAIEGTGTVKFPADFKIQQSPEDTQVIELTINDQSVAALAWAS